MVCAWLADALDQAHVIGYVTHRSICFCVLVLCCQGSSRKKCLVLNHATQVSSGQMVWFPWACGSVLDGFTCGNFQGTHWHLEFSELKLHVVDAFCRWYDMPGTISDWGLVSQFLIINIATCISGCLHGGILCSCGVGCWSWAGALAEQTQVACVLPNHYQIH